MLALALGGTAQVPVTSPQPPSALPVEVARVELVAVGDIMMHQDVKTAGAQAPGGLADLWADVSPLLTKADIAFGNLETPVAPRTGKPGAPYQFNAPAELPDALKASGFTLLSTANNHAFDQGQKGVAETLERLETAGLLAVGSGATRAQAEAPRILEVKGMRIAILGFTDVFNANLDGKADRPWVRPLDPEAAVQAVRAVRPQVDAVIVSIHWGAENIHTPLARQKALAARLGEAGADLILGHHPHVLQPVELVGRTVVAYSLGNFIANQDRMYRPDLFPVAAGDCRDGAAFRCRFVKLRMADGTERVKVENVACVPLWTENNWREVRTGKARGREIRVIDVNAAFVAAEKELERLLTSTPVDKGRVVEQQERLRMLFLRRQRVASILGEGFTE